MIFYKKWAKRSARCKKHNNTDQCLGDTVWAKECTVCRNGANPEEEEHPTQPENPFLSFGYTPILLMEEFLFFVSK